MRILQFLNITHNTIRIGLVSHIGQRRHQFFTRKIFNFEQTVREATNFRTYNSYSSKVEFNSLSASKVSNTNENDAVISTFDLFSIGIGPSSSHTVGPMRAAKKFIEELKQNNVFHKITRIRIDLYGSLALTGKGHGTPNAILMGLEGETPDEIDTAKIVPRIAQIYETDILKLDGMNPIKFIPEKHIIFHYHESLPIHPNGMRFIAFDEQGDCVASSEFFSTGGGFIIGETEIHENRKNIFRKNNDLIKQKQNAMSSAFPFSTAGELLQICKRENMTIAQMVYQNELQWRSKGEIKKKVMEIWNIMDQSIRNGCLSTVEYLPGSLKVRRRAPGLYNKLLKDMYPQNSSNYTAIKNSLLQPLAAATRKLITVNVLDVISVYAIAVNEENAAGGKVVTAPTNGASGVIPAVLKYYLEFISEQSSEKEIMDFLFTSAAIGMLYKKRASISAAEMGCQGEIGVACSMAAAAFAAVMGGTLEQIEDAAEIGMEHNLGLTCDPIDGLVQIPCIERNALGGIKALGAAQLALRSRSVAKVTLDQVIETMRQTGIDMQTKYKETSQGGLAVNVPLC
ncbi:serine dehydratase alpha chain-domain-containing protein [Rhizophagus diaphanus]|nr:serine dehydratase alpha chain-domain-containing protein [Rhizophagus diaphanus] [Rhizophagus sp. MUCL 43196]